MLNWCNMASVDVYHNTSFSTQLFIQWYEPTVKCERERRARKYRSYECTMYVLCLSYSTRGQSLTISFSILLDAQHECNIHIHDHGVCEHMNHNLALYSLVHFDDYYLLNNALQRAPFLTLSFVPLSALHGAQSTLYI